MHEVEVSGSRGIQILLALLLLGAAAYVVIRSLNARRRGEDVGPAAASAMRAVGPPLVLAVVGLVALSIFAAVGALILVVAIISALSGDDDGAGTLVVLWISGMGVLLVAVVGAVAWGLVRMLRSGRDRGGAN